MTGPKIGMHVGQEDTQGGERARVGAGGARKEVSKVILSPLQALDKVIVVGSEGTDGG